MNYEKKYKEALERARIWQNHLYDTNDKDYANELNYIFPELAESEDEKIRKALIRFHKSTIEVDGIKGEDIIAWLEKQGDKDSQVKLPTFTFDDILALQCCMETAKKVQNDKDLYEKLNDLHGRIYDAYYLEKQGEPNPYSGVSFKYNGHTWGMCARDNGVDILLDKQLFKHLDTQNKQKPIFNADDWYVSKVDGKIHNFKFVENRNEQKSID